MSKAKNTKLTLAALIEKKAAREVRANRTEEVFVDSLDGMLTLSVPPKDIVYKSIDMQQEGNSVADTMYSNALVIYHSVELFRDPELLKAYEVSDNIEIVSKILEPYEVNDIAVKVLELGGYSKPGATQADLKN
ncbi:phage tail assembly chaperone [Paenibacillus sp. MMS18-CY102]|uniref:phage tail assembly chaperone n=1 Tax=Paenibacillus sp. MMS18-CY102 TaxID=2682849 RepID=UPI0013665326|nr:hypothetical protein [Paenibacillus sp. MMS18-CY102]MWC26632.1 hypothetical protein [Paenibacillus sp. MMS18-CY102]